MGTDADPQRLLHRRLAVFEESFGEDSAIQICGFAPLDEARARAALEVLRNKRVVCAQDEGAQRLCLARIPEPLPESEMADLRRRHMEWHLELLEFLRPSLYSDAQNEAFDLLDRMRPNLLVALSEAARPEHDGYQLLRMVGVLARYWFVRAHLDEGIEWCQAGMSKVPMPSCLVGLRVWNSAALLLDMKGEHARAIEVQRQVIDHAVRLQEPEAEAGGRINLATFMRNADRLEEAHAIMQAAIPQLRAVGDRNKLASMLINLAAMSIDLDRPEAALLPLREASELAEQLGDSWLMAHVAYNYGKAYRCLGDPNKAQDRLEDALWIYYRLRDTRNMGDTLKQLAELAGGSGDFDRSAVLVGAAELAREVSGSSAPVYDLKSELITVVRARLVLGDAEFDRKWQSGHEMETDEAVRFAAKR